MIFKGTERHWPSRNKTSVKPGQTDDFVFFRSSSYACTLWSHDVIFGHGKPDRKLFARNIYRKVLVCALNVSEGLNAVIDLYGRENTS